MQVEQQEPTKLDRLMQVVSEHHLLRGKVDVDLDGFRVRIESNSEALLRDLSDHFHRNLYKSTNEKNHLLIIAIEAAEPELGLPYKPWHSAAKKVGCTDEFADIDGGRVVRKPQSGMHFLLGADMTLAVGPCHRHKEEIIHLVDLRSTDRVLELD